MAYRSLTVPIVLLRIYTLAQGGKEVVTNTFKNNVDNIQYQFNGICDTE